MKATKVKHLNPMTKEEQSAMQREAYRNSCSHIREGNKIFALNKDGSKELVFTGNVDKKKGIFGTNMAKRHSRELQKQGKKVFKA